MFNISNFLEKIKGNLNSTELQKRRILEIIENNTGIKIIPENLEIKNYIIYVNISPAIKNKIFIEKNKILGEISKITTITDIR